MNKFKIELANKVLVDTLRKTDEVKSLLLCVSFDETTETTILGEDSEIAYSIANHIVQVQNEAELELWRKLARVIDICLNQKDLAIKLLNNKVEIC